MDSETSRDVPLVELKTTSEVTYFTDSSGMAASYEPGLMGQKVFFYVKSDGYEYPQDELALPPTSPPTRKMLRLYPFVRL